VQRRMLERDDEDLAIEQLPAAGWADDPELAGSAALRCEPPQELMAERGERELSAATPARLRELRDQIESLQAQLEALPSRRLEHLEHFEERALTLSTQRERYAERLAQLPERRRRFGRERNPDAKERLELTSAIELRDRELEAVLTRHSRLARELGNPSEMRAERDGLERAIRQSTQERSEVRDELAERELRAPGPWVRETFGESPSESWAAERWDEAIRRVAGYRAEYEITDPRDALGPRPEQHEQRHDWERAREAIRDAERRLGRDAQVEHEIDFGMGF